MTLLLLITESSSAVCLIVRAVHGTEKQPLAMLNKA